MAPPARAFEILVFALHSGHNQKARQCSLMIVAMQIILTDPFFSHI
jgi:hypothetical protein